MREIEKPKLDETAPEFSDEDIESSWLLTGSKHWPGTLLLRNFLEALGARPK